MPDLPKMKACLTILLLLCPLLTWPQQQPRNSQVQVARQFLLAVLGGNWDAAYQHLSPTARQQLPLPAFRTATQPIIDQARTYGPVIDLYKLGYRLREEDAIQSFVAFTYRADSLRPGPHVQLDVTFQDSSARQIQGFSIVPLRTSK
ncbi:hypothetical protein ACFPAF_02995 [Hymenobacter endophyticus]|uniref:DUF3887 domain-containing protein n=1 Tax=Hymenobacter endophyticus TaxID=3076335 RepID=A0ABU3TD90_9BACT|nr:hypothetical protein [Hymenobacter endophyticus]MDU0369351.1 hypothetical protein [Hymenobacter endophyticus]